MCQTVLLDDRAWGVGVTVDEGGGDISFAVLQYGLAKLQQCCNHGLCVVCEGCGSVRGRVMGQQTDTGHQTWLPSIFGT